MREHVHIRLSTAKNIAVIAVDIDLDAERIAIIDRQTFQPLFISSTQTNMERQVPMEYARSPQLMILMLDDSGNYNAAVADVVQAQVVSGTAGA